MPPAGAAYAEGWFSPLEALARLSLGTTYRTPVVPRVETPNLADFTTSDCAAGLGYVQNALMQCLALALATQSVLEWPRIQRLAAPLLLTRLRATHRTRAMVTGPLRYRVRLVLHDVFFDLALLRSGVSRHAAAQRVHIPERVYRALYREIAGAVDTWAQEGAYEAKRRLGCR
jgi:hypothetical protein